MDVKETNRPESFDGSLARKTHDDSADGEIFSQRRGWVKLTGRELRDRLTICPTILEWLYARDKRSRTFGLESLVSTPDRFRQ